MTKKKETVEAGGAAGVVEETATVAAEKPVKKKKAGTLAWTGTAEELAAKMAKLTECVKKLWASAMVLANPWSCVYMVEITTTEWMLGMVTKDFGVRIMKRDAAPEAKHVPDTLLAEEHERVVEDGETPEGGTQMTVWPLRNGIPLFFNYQIVGWLLDTLGFRTYDPHSPIKDCTAWKKKIRANVFIHPREILITVPPAFGTDNVGIFTRPCRVQDAKTGQMRTFISVSECLPAGSKMTFYVTLVNPAESYPLLLDCLNMGSERGFGQWRGSGKGTYTYAITQVA